MRLDFTFPADTLFPGWCRPRTLDAGDRDQFIADGGEELAREVEELKRQRALEGPGK